jgi:hypothetical protein
MAVYIVLYTYVLGCFLFVKRNVKLFVFTIGLLLVVFAGIRGAAVDRDYNNYVSYFELASPFRDYLTGAASFINEPAANIIASVVKDWFGGSSVIFFIIFAILGITIKIHALSKLSEFLSFSVLIYFTNYFFLHDMTQIRAAVSIAFFLLSLDSIYRKKLGSFLLFVFMGALFHYSILVTIPLYFLNVQKLNRAFYALLLIGITVLGWAHVNIFNTVFVPIVSRVSPRFAAYTKLILAADLYNPLYIIRVAICLFLIWKAELLAPRNKYFIILLKINIISLCLFSLFSSVGAVAYRLREFLGVVEVILLPMIPYAIKERKFAIAVVVVLSLVILLGYLFQIHIVGPYTTAVF